MWEPMALGAMLVVVITAVMMEMVSGLLYGDSFRKEDRNDEMDRFTGHDGCSVADVRTDGRRGERALACSARGQAPARSVCTEGTTAAASRYDPRLRGDDLRAAGAREIRDTFA